MRGCRKRKDQGFLISYWPASWGDPQTGQHANWLASGYMVIVPDPLDQPLPPAEPPPRPVQAEDGAASLGGQDILIGNEDRASGEAEAIASSPGAALYQRK